MRSTFGVILILGLYVTGCASPDQLLKTRGLSEKADFARQDARWSGTFKGIDAQLKASSTKNINILFVHGIGWTQESADGAPFGFDLAAALSKAYGDTAEAWRNETQVCPRSTLVQPQDSTSSPAGARRGLTISNTAAPVYSTDDPVLKVFLTDQGCLDRLTVRRADGGTITIYRYFWDDALWNGIEWFHTGYDDRFPRRANNDKYELPGYDDLEELRARGNAALKDSVVTWGLTDAAAYLGPAGPHAREGVMGAMCAAASSMEDLYQGATADAEQRTWRRMAADLCASQTTSRDPLLVMAHSLGSRVVFDVLTADLRRPLAEKLDALSNSALEVYFFANQIPLVATGRIYDAAERARSQVRIRKDIRFVAFSEINDILTYELVPYFEHMYYLRCHGYRSASEPGPVPGCSAPYDTNYYEAQRTFIDDVDGRQRLVQALGFDVIDVRLRFAGAIPILDLVRPDKAHQGYLTDSAKARRLLLCGLDKGTPNTCSAAD